MKDRKRKGIKTALVVSSVLATSSIASAQTSLALYGVVDTLLAVGRGTVSNRNQITSGGNTTTRLGFRGAEDLGGGYSASFVLEAGLATDSGAGAATSLNNQPLAAAPAAGGQGLTFNRRSTVSVASPYGELRLGRDYVPTYSNMGLSDVFGNAGVGTSIMALLGVTSRTVGGIRSSNGIGYFLPRSLGGLYGNVMVAFGENQRNGAATEKDGDYRGVRVGWVNGPLNIAIATGRFDMASGDMRSTNAALTYTVGNLKAAVGHTTERIGPTRGKGVQIGGQYSVGAGQFRASYGNYRTEAGLNPSTSKIALGYVHNLSKRSAVYFTWARVRNKGGAAYSLNRSVTGANSGSTGLDFGVRHVF